MRLTIPVDVVTVASAGKQLLFCELVLVPLAREAVVTRPDVEELAAVVDGALVLFCELLLVPLARVAVVTCPGTVGMPSAGDGAVDVALLEWSCPSWRTAIGIDPETDATKQIKNTVEIMKRDMTRGAA
jgi:hypothetical protein